MNLVPIEHGGQRVLTTQQLADGYGTEAQVITNNFNRNKERYQSGIHYFALSGEKKRAFINQNHFDLGLKNAATIYLWTEKGALYHAKSLNTDRAWQVYDKLVDTYFRVNQIQSIEDLIIMQAQAMKQIRTEVAAVSEKTENLNHRVSSLDLTDIQGTPRQRFEAMVKKYAFDRGILIPFAWKAFDQAFNTAYHKNLTALRENYSKREGLSKTVSRPEYLETAGLIEDAIRVADKLLNS